MSKRPRELKQANRIRKALRPPTTQRYINLIEYLVDHKLAPTNRAARQMLIDGKVRLGSHKVGRVEIEVLGRKEWVAAPYIPADRRNEIVVIP